MPVPSLDPSHDGPPPALAGLPAPAALAAGPTEVLDFWRASAGDWFSQRPAFDQDFRQRFLAMHEAVAGRGSDHWAGTADGRLALLILLDQFPRNAFRGSARMYATDAMARRVAHHALAAGQMAELGRRAARGPGPGPELDLFLVLPFAHSEDLDDQALSVSLNARLGQPWLAHAQGHHDIIRRYGRFPHRNRILGRRTRPDEQAFLDRGGFAG